MNRQHAHFDHCATNDTRWGAWDGGAHRARLMPLQPTSGTLPGSNLALTDWEKRQKTDKGRVCTPIPCTVGQNSLFGPRGAWGGRAATSFVRPFSLPHSFQELNGPDASLDGSLKRKGAGSGCAPSPSNPTCSLTLSIFTAFVTVLFMMVCCICPQAAFGDEEHNRVAQASEMADARMLGSPDMVPISASDVEPGTYDVSIDSSSSFFKIVSAKLVVENDQMHAVMTMRTSSYTLVYLGTGEQAAKAPASDYLAFDEATKTFTIPVDALDANLDCAAFSKNRKKWYDRKIMVRADSLPESALRIELPEYEEADGYTQTDEEDPEGGAWDTTRSEAVALDGMEDGEYSIEVNMAGGSGRASVSSPTWLTIKDGRAYARLLWSSSYYDYMIVGGQRYDNETTDGSNSTFTIPITALDDEISVIADTTAMGDPVEIEYHLTFYSGTIGEKNLIPQEAAILVLELALVIIVVGGILNWLLKKRRKH